MKNHTIRCLKTLSCLPRDPGRVTTSEIHRRLQDEGFSVSLRTLQRDLESLSGSFPIGSENQGRSLAWYWAGKATLFSIPSMDAYTALTFLLAETNMQALFPAGIRASMTPYFDAARGCTGKTEPAPPEKLEGKNPVCAARAAAETGSYSTGGCQGSARGPVAG